MAAERGDIRPQAEELIQFAKKVERLVPYKPKAKQIEALWYLCEGRADLILIARTGFGKSMIFQLAPTLIKGICLMVSPLTLLSEIR